MKRIFIIHGWTGKPNEHWLPWLAEELRQKGFEVYSPEMPETDNPKIDSWVPYLKEQVGIADKNTYFVGHSIGCLTILRYLEKYNENIGGVVLVAPWVTLNSESFVTSEDKEVVDSWTAGSFNWQKLKSLCPNFVALFSKDDPDVPFDDNKPIFEKELGAKIIIEDNKGHFTSEKGVNELPEVLEELLRMTK
ncbi:MAG: alpha/beta fold hydrolase [Patescibacteria group bacterium]|mgnify:FL=1